MVDGREGLEIIGAEGGNRTRTRLPSPDFESGASACSTTSAHNQNVFKYSLPVPDLRNFSLSLALTLVLNFSINMVSNGA